MKINEKMNVDYKSPEAFVHEIECEGALCDISSSEDYGGVSDDELPIF